MQDVSTILLVLDHGASALAPKTVGKGEAAAARQDCVICPTNPIIHCIYRTNRATGTPASAPQDHLLKMCQLHVARTGTPPSSRVFSIYGHIRPKSSLPYSYYTHTFRSDGSRLLSFESTSFLPIYHNSITNPSCYQELRLLYCINTAYQHLNINIQKTEKTMRLAHNGSNRNEKVTPGLP
jgi:hypothetical protein